MIRRPPRSTLFPTRRSSDLGLLDNDDKIRAVLIVDANGIPRQDLRSEEHTSELQSRGHLVCRLLLEKKKSHFEDQRLTGCQGHHHYITPLVGFKMLTERALQ